jgi:pyruvate/2-oxoglutarate dehydrogenase complex dihydrolipoamide dehydrogenase (E3) component
VQSAGRDGRSRILVLEGGEELRGDELPIAVGQQPNTTDLGLDAAGVELDDKGAINVDDRLRTSAAGIFACGDVATRYQFTHIAAYEARIAVANALHDADRPIDERVVPWAVYTDPALAQVGLSDEAAREQGIEVITASLKIDQVERGLLVAQQAGMIKAVACRDSGELVGVAMVSPRADDLIHEAALAIRLRLRAGDIAGTIHAYPTFSQGLESVMGRLAEQITG